MIPHGNHFILFRFFVQSVLLTVDAEFFQLESIFQGLFIFSGKIIDLLALGTLELYHVVL